jgi:hypothetical protein
MISASVCLNAGLYFSLNTGVFNGSLTDSRYDFLRATFRALRARVVPECPLRFEARRCVVAETKGDGLVNSVESLLAEKQALAAKEKKLIEDLNAALGKMGYRVVSNKTAAPSSGTGKKVGRPPGSGKAQTAKNASGS